MVEMVYEDGKRFYIIEGQKYPSVNTVLGVLPPSTILQAWRERTENWWEIQNYRKLQGNIIHYQVACDVSMNNGFPPPQLPLRIDEKQLLQAIFRDSERRRRFNQEVKLAIAMFKDWELEYNPEWIEVEKVVCSKEYRFAGTVDGRCIIKKYYWAIDVKSNPYIWDKNEYQLNGYRIALREMRLRCDKIGLLNIVPNLRSQAGYKFTEIGDFSRDFIRTRYKFTRQYHI